MDRRRNVAWHFSLAGLAVWLLAIGGAAAVLAANPGRNSPPACTSFAGIEYLLGAVAVVVLGGALGGVLGLKAVAAGRRELSVRSTRGRGWVIAGLVLGGIETLPLLAVMLALSFQLFTGLFQMLIAVAI